MSTKVSFCLELVVHIPARIDVICLSTPVQPITIATSKVNDICFFASHGVLVAITLLVEDDFPFPKVGYVGSLQGIASKVQV